MSRDQHAADAGNTTRPKQTIVQRMEAAVTKLFKPADTYHPEQYYLRGQPGPKARAKAKDSHKD